MHIRRKGTNSDKVKFCSLFRRLVVENRHSTGDETSKNHDRTWLNNGSPSLCSMLSAVLLTIVMATQISTICTAVIMTDLCGSFGICLLFLTKPSSGLLAQ